MPIALTKREITHVMYHYIKSRGEDEAATQRLIAQESNVALGKVNELIRAFESGETIEELVRNGPSGVLHQDRTMGDEEKGVLLNIVQQRQALDLTEMAEQFFEQTGIEVHISTICRTLAELGFTHKKIFCRAMEAKVSVQMAFRRNIGDCYCAEQLVFLDEVGTTSRTARRTHAYAPIGERTKVKQIQVKSETISALGVLSGSDGLLDWYMVAGGMGALDFINALKVVVVPHLNPYPGPNSVVILDNARIHHNEEVLKLITNTGAIVQYLPPYSPQFNPIESVFHVVKMFLRRHADWVQQPHITPFKALDTAFRNISFKNAMNFIRGTKVYTWSEDPLKDVDELLQQEQNEREEAEVLLLLGALFLLL